jgi:hypothetical protein
MSTTQKQPALVGQVEPSARPAAWMVRQGTRTYYVSNAEFVRSSYDYGEFVPLYAPDALEAERKRWAQAFDAMREKTLAAQSGHDTELANVMLRQLAELGFGECARALRA